MTRFDFRPRSILDIDGVRYLNGYEVYDREWEHQPIAWARTVNTAIRLVRALELSCAVIHAYDHDLLERRASHE